MRAALVVVGALGLAGCSSSGTPGPGPDAGTLIVHTQFQAGPVDANGRAAVDHAMGRTRVRVTPAGGDGDSIVTTDRAGDASVQLAPGRYTATFADEQGFDGKGGDLTCDLGGPGTWSVRVQPHGATRLEMICGNP